MVLLNRGNDVKLVYSDSSCLFQIILRMISKSLSEVNIFGSGSILVIGLKY